MSVTVTIRKLSSGYKVASFSMDNLDHAYTIASILIASPQYAGCFAVAVNWQNQTVFSVGQQVAPPPQYYPPPQPQYPQMSPYYPPPQPYPPAQYAPQYAPNYGYQQAYPALPPQREDVIEAEIIPESTKRLGR